jgi:hypothetical protein
MKAEYDLSQMKSRKSPYVSKLKNVHVELSEQDIEISTIYDNSVNFLSDEELNYYSNLEDLACTMLNRKGCQISSL